MIKLHIQNFGPIGKADIELNKLTVIVGQNNTGKSYLATLIYALFKVLPERYRDSVRFGLHGQASFAVPGFYLSSPNPELLALLGNTESTQVLKNLQKALKRGKLVLFKDLASDIQNLLKQALELKIKTESKAFELEIERCFGAKLSELSRRGKTRKSFRISVEDNSSDLSLDLKQQNSQLLVKVAANRLENVRISAHDFPYQLFAPAGSKGTNSELLFFGTVIIGKLERSLFRNFKNGSYYLPAARSGILQSHRALTSAVIRQASFAGIERMDVPRLTGIVTDFISNAISFETRRVGPFNKLSMEFEKEILGGVIGLTPSKFGPSEITYKRAGADFPLHSTSSMISELAPVVLYLRHLVRKGDLLIIEEPEAHLHPSAQRVFASLIPHLINSGVKVLLTTHSDYFLGQLNNFIRLAAVNPEWANKKGYKVNDTLNPGDVSAYLCAHISDDAGTAVKPVEVTSENGISDEVFANIVEDLYQESVRLEQQILETK